MLDFLRGFIRGLYFSVSFIKDVLRHTVNVNSTSFLVSDELMSSLFIAFNVIIHHVVRIYILLLLIRKF